MFETVIKVKVMNPLVDLPEVFSVGDWIDLKTPYDISGKAPVATYLRQVTLDDGTIKKFREVEFDSVQVSLGIAMKLPEGYEAILAPRSSSYHKCGFVVTNSIGVIDNSYSGNNDEWKLPVEFHRTENIPAGTRICQFRIQLSQKATFLQKLKWMFSSKIVLQKVENLDDTDRGGFGEGTKLLK